MSIKIYSGYDEFKYEEPELCDCIDIEERDSYEDEQEEESNDVFFYATKTSDFIDSSTFYVVSDLEDEENAEDISGYLGKFKKMYIPDFHKVLFCVN
jgi:hypothetical protein